AAPEERPARRGRGECASCGREDDQAHRRAVTGTRAGREEALAARTGDTWSARGGRCRHLFRRNEAEPAIDRPEGRGGSKGKARCRRSGKGRGAGETRGRGRAEGEAGDGSANET